METKEPKETQSPERPGTGPFEFFRKYQKLILYTAGIFALVSFSITGALMGFFDTVFRQTQDYGTIEIAGRVVPVTEEDYAVATRLRQSGTGYPAVVLPPIGGHPDDNRLDMFALLRRAAIETGIEVSSAEVDRAIDQAVQQRVQQSVQTGQNIQWTPTQVALSSGHSSLGAFEEVVTEAMRIGTYLRLESLAADTSDAALVAAYLEERKKIALKVAELDREALQEELEAQGVDDETLQAWLAELDDLDSAPFRDTNHVSLMIAAAFYGQFNREEFTEELADIPVPGEEQMLTVYERDKEKRFRKEEPPPPEPDAPDPDAQDPLQDPDPYKPYDDVKGEIQQMLEAEEVLRQFWTKVQIARNEHLTAPQEVRNTALSNMTTFNVNAVAARQAADADPDNEELQQAVEEAEAELEAKQAELDAAETALDEARANFDMRAAFEAAVKGRPGFSVLEVPEDGPTGASGLEELGDLGGWADTWAATSMSRAGDLSSLVQRADHGAFHFIVTDLVERPLKPFEEIKDEATTEYFRVRSDELATEKGEAFEAALLRLAKEQLSERIAELEAEQEVELEARVAKWREETEARRDETRQKLERIADPRLNAYKREQATLDALVAELADEEGKREEITATLDQETEETIESEARELYGEVLEEAAAEAGFAVETLPAYPRSIANDDPRFKFRYPESVQFLFQDQTVMALEPGDVTELLDDTTGRALRMAVCTAEEDVTLADLTRRDIVRFRTGASLGPGLFVPGMGFPEQRLQDAYVQSFSEEALRKRLKWVPSNPPEEEVVAGPGGADQSGGTAGGPGKSGEPGRRGK